MAKVYRTGFPVATAAALAVVAVGLRCNLGVIHTQIEGCQLSNTEGERREKEFGPLRYFADKFRRTKGSNVRFIMMGDH